jgi:hypothetical protein
MLNNLGCMKPLCPWLVVDVASHNHDGRDLAKVAKYFPTAYVPGMEDEFASVQRPPSLGPEQAMSVTDHANRHLRILLDGETLCDYLPAETFEPRALNPPAQTDI